MTETQPAQGSASPDAAPDRQRWAVLAVLCLSLLIVGLDTTVLNVALPTLVSELGASTSELQWLVDIYSLMAASLMLFCGSLADRLGRKALFLAGVVVFTGASAVAAYAETTTTLMIARGCMGVGEAMIMPATLSLIGSVFTDRVERAKAIGVWSAVMGVGLAVGPLLGGWLLGQFWWGSIFLINVPIGVFALIVALKIVPNPRSSVRKRLDVAGVLLSIVAMGSLLWGVIEGPSNGWTSASVLSAFVVAALGTVGFIGWERRTPEPMLPLGIFRHRTLAMGNVLVLLGLLALLGALFVLVQYLQFVLDYSASETGLRIAPTALVILVAAPVASLLSQRVGTRWIAALGLTFAAVSLVLLATTTDGDGYDRLLVAMLFLGSGAGFLIGPTSDAIVGSLPENDLGVGSATNSSSVQVGASLGVAILGSLLADRYGSELDDGLARAGVELPPHAAHTAGESVGAALAIAAELPGQAAATVAATARSAFVSGMQPAMYAGAAAATLGALLALSLFPKGRPATDPSAGAAEPGGAPSDAAPPARPQDRA